MTDQYVARFRSGTTDQRRAAIIKLGKAGDPRAISLLQQLTIGEPDPALQTIAFRAIHHLESLALAEPVNTPPPTPIKEPAILPVAVPPPAIAATPQEPVVGSKLDRVIALQMEGQFDHALTALAEIVRTDPDVLKGTVGANLAMTLTDLPRDQAVAAIIAKSKTIKSNTVQGTSASRVLFDLGALFDTLLETAALLIVLILLFVVVRVGIVSLANRLLTNLSATYGQGSAANSSAFANAVTQMTKGQQIDPATMNQLETQMQQGQFNADSPQFRALLINQVLSAFGKTQSTAPSTKTMLLDSVNSGLHLLLFTAATILATFLIGRILRGKGGLIRFFRALNRAYLITYGLALAGLALWLLVLQVPTLSPTLQLICAGVGLLLIVVSGLYGFKRQLNAVSQAHQFGGTRGFIAVMLGSFIVTLILGLTSLQGLTAALHTLR